MQFLTTLADVLNSIYIPKIHMMDLVEIGILIIALYKLITRIIGTRAMVVIQGLLYMFGIYVIAYLLNFNAIVVIFQNIMTICLLAIVLIFQPELRRFIEDVGTNTEPKLSRLRRLFPQNKGVVLRYSDSTVDNVVDACVKMGKVKTGALIVFERDIPLKDYIRSGIDVNADLSSALLINIFEKNTPLHDGAVIVKGNKVVSATCYLPLTNSTGIDKDLGTRHRAAIGVSEMTDSIVVTVSEETGAISFIKEGKIKHNISADELKKELKKMQVKNEEVKVGVKNPLDLLKNNWVYKLIALIVGVIAWVLLINIYNPVYTDTFENIPITVVNADIVESQNKTYSLDKISVDVAVTSSRKDVEKLKAEDITVIADINNVTLADSIMLTVNIDKLKDKSVSIVGGNFVHITFDDLISQEFIITPDVTLGGSLSDTFTVGDVRLTQDSVSISGPSNLINKIGVVKASVLVDTPEDYNGVVDLTIYDKNGDLINSDSISYTDKIGVIATLHSFKEVPLNIDVVEVNPIEDYSVWKIKYAQESVRVSGDDIALTNINGVNIHLPLDMQSIDIVNNEYLIDVDVSKYIPEDVKLVGSTSVGVTVTFSTFSVKELNIRPQNIDLRNIPNDVLVVLGTEDVYLSVRGATEDIDNITVNDIKPYIDLSGKSVGRYSLAISCDNNSLGVINSGTISIDLVSNKTPEPIILDVPEVTVQPEITEPPIESSPEVTNEPESTVKPEETSDIPINIDVPEEVINLD